MSFSANLQFLRKRSNITQEELADRLQVSRQSVSKWETGEAYPETEKIIALCDIFGVTMDDLMRGDVAASPAPPQGEQSGAPAAEEEDSGDFSCTREEAERVKGIEDLPERAKKRAGLHVIGNAINGVILAGSVVTFFCLGGLRGLWHPGWLVFLLALSLCAFVDRAFAIDGGKRIKPLGARLCKGLAGMVILLSVTIYLFIGCVYGIWHPSWVIFIIAVILAGAFDQIARAITKMKS